MKPFGTIACLFSLFVCFATSCHRPYALYQRTTHETYRRPDIGRADEVVTAAPLSPSDWAPFLTDSNASATEPVAYASARPAMPASTHPARTSRIIRLLTAPTSTSPESESQNQPRPKPKTQAQPQRKTFREVLGLAPRKKLNWWQRISWKLKASVIVILVAVVFALLHITILAIIFGLLGAFLLIKGLKRSFKVRRPWF